MKTQAWRWFHRFYRNELGYRNGQPGRAGPFIYVEKDIARRVFPFLSPLDLNAAHQVVVYVDGTKRPFVLQLVFHNSKTADPDPSKTRREYRLYVTPLVQQFPDLIQPSKAVVIEPILVTESGLEFAIRITPIPSDAPDMQRFIGRNNNVFELLQSEVEVTSDQRLTAAAEAAVSDDSLLDKMLKLPIQLPPQARDGEVTRLRARDGWFNRCVKETYGYLCAVTGKTLGGRGYFAIDAAHIIPVKDGGSDNPQNGIPLCKTLHYAFDLGLFTFDQAGKVFVHPECSDLTLHPDLADLRISTPRDARLGPHPSALEWHRRNVFGQFLG